MKSKKQSWILAGGLLAALAASICCIGPLIALTLGIGGLAAASSFAEWRPYFLGASFVLLGAAWYLTYRRPRATAECAPGKACASRPARTTQKIVLWIVTTIAVPAALFPYLIPSASIAASSAPAVGGAELRVSIPTMDCAACAKGIEATLRRQPGVLQATVDYDSKQGVIVFDAQATSANQLVAAIDSTGFKAEGIATQR